MQEHARDGHAVPGGPETAAQYDAVIDRLEPELHKVSQMLLDVVNAREGSRLLDVACGPGHTAAAATARGALATGVDVDPAMIDVAKARFPDTDFIVGDMQALPAGSWACVTCRLGAHHARSRWLRSAFDVLVPGGALAIAEFDALDDESRERGMRGPGEWRQLMIQAGFEDIRTRECIVALGTLVAKDPELRENPLTQQAFLRHDGPLYVIWGTKPDP